MRALDQPWVGPALRRKWSVMIATLVLGLAMLATFVGLTVHYSDLNDKLRSSGGRTQGVVTSLTRGSKYSGGAAEVAYDVEGVRFSEAVDLGSAAGSYRLHQAVTVFYDRQHPASMTIDSVDNQPPGTVLPMILLLVFGFLGAAFGFAGIRMWWRRRPLLDLPWKPVSATQEVVRYGRSRHYILRLAEGPSIRMYAKIKADTDRFAGLLVDNGKLAIVGFADRGLLRAGRIPQRRRWQRRRTS